MSVIRVQVRVPSLPAASSAAPDTPRLAQAVFRGHRTRELVRDRVMARIDDVRAMRPRRRRPLLELLAEELGVRARRGDARGLAAEGLPPQVWSLLACTIAAIGLPQIGAFSTGGGQGQGGIGGLYDLNGK